MQIEGADGVLQTRVFKGLEKVEIRRDVRARDDVGGDGGEVVQEGEAGKGEGDVTKEEAVKKEETVKTEETVKKEETVKTEEAVVE